MQDEIDSAPDLTRLRLRIGNIFIKSGDGLEIAPWNNPLYLPGCNTRHIEVDPGHVTQPGQVIDNGEILSTIKDGSLDFIIACHIMEHFTSPIRAIETHLRKLKSTGWLYYILPDKDQGSCDAQRETTPFDRLVELYMCKKPPFNGDMGHLHVWNAEAAREFFDSCNNFLGNPYEVVHFSVNPPNAEDIVMLKKVREAAGPLAN